MGSLSCIGNDRIRHTALLLLIYLPIWYCEMSSLAFTPAIANTAISLPLWTYLHMYFIDFTELQNSTFIWALYVFDNNGQYGTTHLLSISISFAWFLLVNWIEYVHLDLASAYGNHFQLLYLLKKALESALYIFYYPWKVNVNWLFRMVHESYSLWQW